MQSILLGELWRLNPHFVYAGIQTQRDHPVQTCTIGVQQRREVCKKERENNDTDNDTSIPAAPSHNALPKHPKRKRQSSILRYLRLV